MNFAATPKLSLPEASPEIPDCGFLWKPNLNPNLKTELWKGWGVQPHPVQSSGTSWSFGTPPATAFQGDAY